MTIIRLLAVGLQASLPTQQQSAAYSAGYLFGFASSLQEALRCLKEGDFDAILLSVPARRRKGTPDALSWTACTSGVPQLLCRDLFPFADATLPAGAGNVYARISGTIAVKANRLLPPPILRGVAF